MKRKRDGPNNGSVKLQDIVSPDFEELARISPSFCTAYRQVQERQKREGGNISKFVTQEYTVALSKAILSMHFGLDLQMPMDRLCPPIPNRYYFTTWLHDILKQKIPLLSTNNSANNSITGLDIGTGASAIYALLWTHLDKTSRFFASDIDQISVNCAQNNVRINQLEDRIQVITVKNSDETAGPLRQSLLAVSGQQHRFNVCMFNPPFYHNAEPIDKPNRTSITYNEGFYPGGEAGFVSDVLWDCLNLFAAKRPVPRLVACMCGKKESFVHLRHVLTQVLGRSHVQESEFGPGQHTRWFLAWTLERPPLDSPLAKLAESTFDVVPELPKTRVCERLIAYFEGARHMDLVITSTQGGDLVEVRERTPCQSWTDDSALPLKIRQVLPPLSIRTESFLPGSHFYLRFQTHSNNNSNNASKVTIEVFAHSAWGKRTVEKWIQQLPGEINRTNRKWRRLLQRAQESSTEMAIDG